MRKSVFYYLPTICSFFIISCTPTKPFYYWGTYDVSSYNYLKNNDDKSTQELISNYKLITGSQNSIRQVAPPGIYADYGFLLLRTGKIEEGNSMLEKEISLYPESRVFIERVIKMQK